MAVGLLLAGGCTGGHTLASRPGTVELAAGPVAWFGPSVAEDIAALDRWRRSVGPPVIAARGGALPTSDRLIVVNWNLHVGAGDVRELVGRIRADAGAEVPVVLLVQEAYRSGTDVPRMDSGGAFASLIRAARSGGGRDTVEEVSEALGLHAYYVPSMRNGGAGSDEDRGNAILSTVPLEGLHAIELPFERQRRVAVGATISGRTRAGEPWSLRVVSAHLDTFGGARRLWLAGGELSRARQARGLVGALDDGAPMVLGADLNTWFGFRDRAYREAIRAFPQTHVTDRRATFGGLLRLDHLFFRLPDRWRATFVRGEQTYGSDHYPLIGEITFR